MSMPKGNPLPAESPTQSIALFLSLALYVVLTHAFGIAGTVCTLLLGSGIYLIGSGVYARRSPELKIAS